MKILAIETSCDETAVAILECLPADGANLNENKSSTFRVLGNALLSQIELHRKYGGVFPMMAKRAHSQNLTPLLRAALEEAELIREDTQVIPEVLRNRFCELLVREPELLEQLLEFLAETETPDIDVIAVTRGPGLEPVLWVGVNLAQALALAWNKPLAGVNHMEGHLLAALVKEDKIENIQLPLLGLLISGGHTELVRADEWLSYDVIGETRDDAVGEAFDKVARMLNLPYPGGPEISRLADLGRKDPSINPFKLPRPMKDAPHLDFSFSGLKTAVLYLLKGKPEFSEIERQKLAEEFEDAVTDVLWTKSSRALRETGARTLALGGGVSANAHIRKVFEERIGNEHPGVSLYVPVPELATDNAVMIGIAAYYHALRKEFTEPGTMQASGNSRTLF